MTSEGTITLFTGGEGMTAVTRHVFPELQCVKLSAFKDTDSSVCQFQEQVLEMVLTTPRLLPAGGTVPGKLPWGGRNSWEQGQELSA